MSVKESGYLAFLKENFDTTHKKTYDPDIPNRHDRETPNLSDKSKTKQLHCSWIKDLRWSYNSIEAMKLFSFHNKRDIYRIHVSHTLHNVALSIISVYIPISLLTLGYSLSKTITFFIAFHLTGLLFVLLICPPLIRKWGLIRLLKIYYPLEIGFFVLLNFLSVLPGLFWIIAIIGGLATFSYWIPLKILLIKNAELEKMGSDVANFFALPKVFGILGPLVSAALIPLIGFWPVFTIVIVGLILSYLPLRGIRTSEITQSFDFRPLRAWSKLRERKLLFLLEGFDNIVEESEWFWGIFVFLIIGALEAPGIMGSLEALGGAAFTVIVGKYANKSSKILIPIASAGLVITWVVRVFIENALPAYIITLVASFVMTLFLISYFSMIYRTVKNRQEEEFLLLREIPTVLGRMVVFGTILITVANPRLFFLLPIITTIVLLSIFISRKEKLAVQ